MGRNLSTDDSPPGFFWFEAIRVISYVLVTWIAVGLWVKLEDRVKSLEASQECKGDDIE